MVRINRVYTRTGDDGSTGLGDFTRTSKTDVRLAAYADADEAGAAIGVVLTHPDEDAEVDHLLRRIQNDLFDVGADLCLPLAAEYAHEPLRVKQEWITELETAIDSYNDVLPRLTTFVLAGGTPRAAQLHVARTVARRAERSVWAAIESYGTTAPGGINPLTAQYLNRLSDLLFVLARHANRDIGDVLWQPGGGR